jgi:hypothetical protein
MLKVAIVFQFPSFNFPKPLVGLFQAVWAIVTIYRAQGDQISQYGYAAFGLTVVPYAFMSILNAIGNLLTPTYPSLLLIRTPMMDQAEKEEYGGEFPYAIKVDLGMPSQYRERRSKRKLGSSLLLGLVIGIIPLILVGALSGFHTGSSTTLQRGFVMSWLFTGILIGPWMHVLQTEGEMELSGRLPWKASDATELLENFKKKKISRSH